MSKVYVIDGGSAVKIGRAKDVERRLASLRASSPCTLRLAGSFAHDDVALVESIAHRALAAHRLHGEWFGCSADKALEVMRQALSDASATPVLRMWVDDEFLRSLDKLCRRELPMMKRKTMVKKLVFEAAKRK